VSPNVRIWTEARDGVVKLFVRDNGIGIAPQHKDKIFGIFQRLHSSSEYPGTGVGLALVRRGVERMGGKVHLESAPGDGSTFCLELPRSGVRIEEGVH
jgi:signal transduction histidine kinase